MITLFCQFPGMQPCRLFLDAARMGDDGGILEGGIRSVREIDKGRPCDSCPFRFADVIFLLPNKVTAILQHATLMTAARLYRPTSHNSHDQ